MGRRWNEADHPRDDDGQFTGKIGDAWAHRIVSQTNLRGTTETKPPGGQDGGDPHNELILQDLRTLASGKPTIASLEPGQQATVTAADLKDTPGNEYEIYDADSGGWFILDGVGGYSDGTVTLGNRAGFDQLQVTPDTVLQARRIDQTQETTVEASDISDPGSFGNREVYDEQAGMWVPNEYVEEEDGMLVVSAVGENGEVVATFYPDQQVRIRPRVQPG